MERCVMVAVMLLTHVHMAVAIEYYDPSCEICTKQQVYAVPNVAVSVCQGYCDFYVKECTAFLYNTTITGGQSSECILYFYCTDETLDPRPGECFLHRKVPEATPAPPTAPPTIAPDTAVPVVTAEPTAAPIPATQAPTAIPTATPMVPETEVPTTQETASPTEVPQMQGETEAPMVVSETEAPMMTGIPETEVPGMGMETEVPKMQEETATPPTVPDTETPVVGETEVPVVVGMTATPVPLCYEDNTLSDRLCVKALSEGDCTLDVVPASCKETQEKQDCYVRVVCTQYHSLCAHTALCDTPAPPTDPPATNPPETAKPPVEPTNPPDTEAPMVPETNQPPVVPTTPTPGGNTVAIPMTSCGDGFENVCINSGGILGERPVFLINCLEYV